MKKNSSGTTKHSRRDFAKSIAAGLVTIPFMPSLVGAQERAGNQGKAVSGCEPRGPVIRTDHIPPVGVLGGSFLLEAKHELSPQSDQSGPRPKIHIASTVAAQQYGRMAMVQIVTELLEEFTYYRYTFYAGVDPRLRIWLRESITNPADPPPFSTPPEILIKGNFLSGTLRTMYVESDKALPREASLKRHRPNRHRRAHNAGFRIHGWQISSSDGNTPLLDGDGFPMQDYGNEAYTFMIDFFDPRVIP